MRPAENNANKTIKRRNNTDTTNNVYRSVEKEHTQHDSVDCYER